MVVHDTALWLLLAVGSAAGGVYALVSELRAPRTDRRGVRFERYVFGTPMGVGFGMAAATLLLLAAALIVRIEP